MLDFKQSPSIVFPFSVREDTCWEIKLSKFYSIKKARLVPRFECFHNGIILIVIRFNL